MPLSADLLAEKTCYDPAVIDISGPGNPASEAEPAARLERLLRSKQCIVYHENIPDREHPQVTCSIYGAPRTNELFVAMTNGRITYVEVVKSRLDYPVMADRVFGLDVLDREDAFRLADKMWEKHQKVFVG